MGEEDYHPSTNLQQSHLHDPSKSNREMEDIIHIATYNTLSLRTNESLTELMLALEDVKWSILGLSEVRRLGECIEDHGNYIFYYKGETPGLFGTGFIIKKELKPFINEFIGISERIVILNVKLPPTNEMWSIVQVYSPTEQSSRTDIDTFYSMLQDAINSHSHNNLVVMGDFNARTGERGDGEQIIMGPYCSGKRSRNGEKLVQLAFENNLKILNTLYRKRENDRWTWVSPDGNHRNEIDYILTNKSKDFQDCRVLNNLNFNSNHRMVRAKLQINTQKKNRPFKVKQINNIKLESTESLKEKLDHFIAETKNLDIQSKYNNFQELLYTNKKGKLANRNDRLKWMTNETKELIRKRADLISIPEKTKTTRNDISDISKKIKTHMRKEHQRYRLEQLKKCIQRTGGTKKAAKLLLEKRNWIPNLINKNHKCEGRRPEILSIATQFFKELYSRENTTPTTLLTGESEIPVIIYEEIEKALKSQKADKAPGSDGISNEFLILNKNHLIPILEHLFNEVLQTEIIPNQWTTSSIVLLHKKGDKNNINNYRPISLTSNIYKIFAKVLLHRLTKTLDENQPREQAGFRSGYSTLDHLHVIKQLFEKGNEYNITFYCCFVDYSKAFDTIEHEKIWQALKSQGIENKYIRVVKNIYDNSKAKIKLEKEGEEIKIERGVRQGDPLSPKLFTAVLEEVFRQLDWENCGLSINGENLSHLRFADDLIILSSSSEGLQAMLNDLVKESAKVGLVMNTLKTKAMTNSRQEPIRIDGNEIEYVNEYIYLGQIISPTDLTSKEIDRRIGNAWKQYWSLKEIMKNKHINITIKRKLFDTSILPILTYGCQTWALNKAHINKLETCQNAMGRSMTGKRLSDRIRTETIKKHTKTKDVTKTILKLKWKWSGHTIRGKDKWSKMIMNWFTSHNKRQRGRPLRRWVDDIKAIAGSTWTRLAGDREEWRKLEEAFANKWHTDKVIVA